MCFKISPLITKRIENGNPLLKHLAMTLIEEITYESEWSVRAWTPQQSFPAWRAHGFRHERRNRWSSGGPQWCKRWWASSIGDWGHGQCEPWGLQQAAYRNQPARSTPCYRRYLWSFPCSTSTKIILRTLTRYLLSVGGLERMLVIILTDSTKYIVQIRTPLTIL